MNFSKVYNFKSPIHYVVFSDKFLAAVDNDTNIIFYDKQSDKLALKQSFQDPVPHPHVKSTSSNISGNLLCLYLQKAKASVLLFYKPEEKKFVLAKKLEWNTSRVECVAFDEQNKLFATGAEDGKVHIYSSKNGKLYESLPKKSDYIASLAFNKNGNLLAYTSYDKSLCVYDIHRNKMLYKGSARQTSVIMKNIFLNNANKIVLASRDGKVVLYDFFKKIIIKNILVCSSWATSLFVSEKDDFLVVADKSGQIYLCDLADEAGKSFIIYKSAYAVLDIKMFNEAVYFVFENGEVKALDLKKEYDDFKIAYENKDFALCYKMMEENKFLFFSDIRKKIDDSFSDILREAIKKISRNEENEAKKMLAPFASDERFNPKIQRNLKLAKKIFEFTDSVEKDDFVKAYRLAASDEVYKEFPAYLELEKKFITIFDNASDLLVKNPPEVIKAKKLLNIFMAIPQKRNLINNLFAQPIIYKKLQFLYEKKEYKALEELVEKHAIAKDSPFYKEFLDFKSNLEFFLELHMDMQEFDEALECALMIEKYFPDIYKKTKTQIDKLKITISFIQSVQNNSFFVAIGYVSRNEFLIELPEYKKLDKFLDKKFDLATDFARKLDFEEMNKILSVFVKNKNLKDRAIYIYKLFYIEQIQKNMGKFKNNEWEIVFKNYTDCFGVDDEIEQLAKNSNVESVLVQFKKERYEEFSTECIKSFVFEKQ
ncbi:MAG: hypothetical protein QG567_1136 [Campylobacterota bacterium]|nr:hypothetical protein [Campylobacterota bacterium]